MANANMDNKHLDIPATDNPISKNARIYQNESRRYIIYVYSFVTLLSLYIAYTILYKSNNEQLYYEPVIYKPDIINENIDAEGSMNERIIEHGDLPVNRHRPQQSAKPEISTVINKIINKSEDLTKKHFYMDQDLREISINLDIVRNDHAESHGAMLSQIKNLTERQSRIEDDIIDMGDQLTFIHRTLARIQNFMAKQENMQLITNKKLDLLLENIGIEFPII